LPSAPQILIATGGTGGHLYPAFAVAEEIECRWPSARVTLTTGSRDIEREVCQSAGRTAIPLPLVPTAAARRRPLQFVKALWAARRMAGRLVAELRPHVVIGTGGFTMTPVVHAALRAKIPVVLLEQNAIPGRATRLFARRTAVVCSSFERMDPPLTGAIVSVTGNPVRASIAVLSMTEERPRDAILILGGSQGARALNESMGWIAANHPQALAPWTVLHQTGGARSAEELAATYQRNGIRADCRPFFADMADAYVQAGLVIARAGATTMAELACVGVPVVLVPYPYARDLHQHANAKMFADRNAAMLIEQGDDDATTARRILVALESLASKAAKADMARQLRALAKPDAASRVVDVIERLLP